MKKILTKALSVFLATLMFLTVVPAFTLAAEELATPAAPVFSLDLKNETSDEVSVVFTLKENSFNSIDLTITGNDNLVITAITFNTDIFNTGGACSSNLANGKISLARADAFIPEYELVTYTFKKLDSESVCKDDFDVTVDACGIDSTDATDSVVVNNNIPEVHTHEPSGEWVTTVPSTCSKKGTVVQYCTICGEVAVSGELALADHTNTVNEHKDATCTEAGYDKVFCNDCKTYLSETAIPATGHDNLKAEHKDATCDETGYDRIVCDNCGEVLEETTIPATNHKDTIIEHKDATCTVAGYDRVICKDCSKVLEETVIPATNHKNTKTEHKDPTCTVAGYDKTICTDCGATLETTPIPATGHQNKKTEYKEPTCTVAGYEKVICKDCGATVSSKTLPAKGHGETTSDNLAPTCTEKGYLRKICVDCKEIISEQPLSALGHRYIQDLKLATCTEDGYLRDYCPACEHAIVKATYKKTGHAWGKWIVVETPTYSKNGTERRICNNCGEDEERSVPKLVAKPEEIVMSMQEIGMNYKQTTRLFANVLPEEAAYSTEVIWESSDESVATVDETGSVYATGVGTATITAKTADGKISATCEVTVKYSAIQWIIVYLLFGWIWYK